MLLNMLVLTYICWPTWCLVFDDGVHFGATPHSFSKTKMESFQLSFMGHVKLHTKFFVHLLVGHIIKDWLICIQPNHVLLFWIKLSTWLPFCKNAVKITDNVVCLGQSVQRSLTVAELVAIEKVFNILQWCDVTVVFAYKRIIINGTLLHTDSYSLPICTNDCFFSALNSTRSFLLHHLLLLLHFTPVRTAARSMHFTMSYIASLCGKYNWCANLWQWY